MYPPIKCPTCGRGDLYIALKMSNNFRAKHQAEILKDNRFKAYSETIKFPLVEVFDKLELMQCCRIEVMAKQDMIADIYGLPGMDKK
jgi:DNA-directed RNA polymerase subunit N (RpoN/RPB10)